MAANTTGHRRDFVKGSRNTVGLQKPQPYRSPPQPKDQRTGAAVEVGAGAAVGAATPALMRLAESTHQVGAARAFLEKTWAEHAEHSEVREQGRADWYAAFTTRVAKVERAYDARDACFMKNSAPTTGEPDVASVARAVSLSCMPETNQLIAVTNPYNDPRVTAAIMAISSSRLAAGAPAITALTAIFSTVHSARAGGRRAITSSG